MELVGNLKSGMIELASAANFSLFFFFSKFIGNLVLTAAALF